MVDEADPHFCAMVNAARDEHFRLKGFHPYTADIIAMLKAALSVPVYQEGNDMRVNVVLLDKNNKEVGEVTTLGGFDLASGVRQATSRIQFEMGKEADLNWTKAIISVERWNNG